MTTRTQYLYEQVNKLMDFVDDMAPKDYDFILSLADYEENGRLITEKQAAWVEDLHRKFC
jgi:hypothetical protein